MTQSNPHKNRRAAPRRITASYLENAAAFYLQRFDSTAENLRRVLHNKVRRAACHPEADIDTAAATQWIEETIVKMQRIGYIDDTRTATAKARALFARGTPPTMIRRRLAVAGAGDDAIAAALNALAQNEGTDDHDMTLKAALVLARRRRLGPFRDPDKRAERHDRDMAALARAGFDFETVRRIIDAPNIAEIENDLGQDGGFTGTGSCE
ncbi:MAG: RecX family transcriptional regulator [Rhodospirillaceae bacterium]|nr:RecX family transcriptional regulator [Rhodospirillaceae bacterium]